MREAGCGSPAREPTRECGQKKGRLPSRGSAEGSQSWLAITRSAFGAELRCHIPRRPVISQEFNATIPSNWLVSGHPEPTAPQAKTPSSLSHSLKPSALGEGGKETKKER